MTQDKIDQRLTRHDLCDYALSFSKIISAHNNDANARSPYAAADGAVNAAGQY
jgi:hypothetical protein